MTKPTEEDFRVFDREAAKRVAPPSEELSEEPFPDLSDEEKARLGIIPMGKDPA